MRCVDWQHNRPVIVEQTLLPGELRFVTLNTVDELIDAIVRLAVRGAPAIGVAGGLGVALAAVLASDDGSLSGDAVAEQVRREAARIRAARPTARNLMWAVDRVVARLDDGTQAVVDEAVSLIDEEVQNCHAIGERGADLVAELVAAHAVGPIAISTHCNAGALACVEWGTALGVVHSLHNRGAVREVFVDETRPLLQGSRLTAFELGEMGVDYRVVVDGATPGLIAAGMVDVVIVGSDRIAANGDVANKVGTYPLALAAARAGIPFIVAAPESTVDVDTPNGDAIVIETRDPNEVLGHGNGGAPTAPPDAIAYNPAFDVTPADLVTAVVTQRRVVRPALGETMHL